MTDIAATPRPSRAPLLPDRQLLEGWLQSYRDTGDRASRDRVVEACIPLAQLYAQRFQRTGASVEDLRQVGLLAVLRAIDRFDPSFQVSFATFAARTIEGELKRYHRDRVWTVRPPRGAQERFLAVQRAQEELTHALMRSPTPQELASRLGETVEHVLEASETGMAYRSTSIEEHRPGDEHESEHRFRQGILSAVDGGYESVEVSMVLRDLLARLSDGDREIVQLRFFENLSQDEIARRLGISQSYLSRLLRGILDTMREQLSRPTAAMN